MAAQRSEHRRCRAAKYTLAAATPADDGALFRVLITNSADTTASEPVTLRVQAAVDPVAISSQPAAFRVLDGGTATLSVTATGTGPFTVVLGPLATSGNASYVLGFARGSLGLGRSPLLSTGGVGFSSMVNTFDRLPTQAAPAGDGRSVVNLWRVFLR